ncbi:MAG: hypothetical protein D6800_14490, partial [Candidatus Zixiibacteriota bacterium]
MMKRLVYILAILVLVDAATPGATEGQRLVWPAPPAQARLEYVGSVDCGALSAGGGLFNKLSRLVGGREDGKAPARPFDVLVRGRTMYLVCQNIPALVVIDRVRNNYRLIQDDKRTLRYPISLCADDTGNIYVTDSESGKVFRYTKGKLSPFITTGLSRPT